MDEDQKPPVTFSDIYEESLWLDTYPIAMLAVIIGETISRPDNPENLHQKNQRHVRYANYVADTALMEARRRRPVRMLSIHRIMGIIGDWWHFVKLIFANSESKRTSDYTRYFYVIDILKKRKMGRFPVWPTNAVVKCAYIASLAAAVTTVVGILTFFDNGKNSTSAPIEIEQNSCVERSCVP